jgi:hypothetical protein
MRHCDEFRCHDVVHTKFHEDWFSQSKVVSGDTHTDTDSRVISYAYLKILRGLVRLRTIPTERPPLVGEANANFSG